MLKLILKTTPAAYSGNFEPKTFQKDEIQIGRRSDMDWIFPDHNNELSRHHCTLSHYNGNYWLKDDSANGTHLNVSPEPLGKGRSVMLHHGDRIWLAKSYEIEVALMAEEDATLSLTGGTDGDGIMDLLGGTAPTPSKRPEVEPAPRPLDPFLPPPPVPDLPNPEPTTPDGEFADLDLPFAKDVESDHVDGLRSNFVPEVAVAETIPLPAPSPSAAPDDDPFAYLDLPLFDGPAAPSPPPPAAIAAPAAVVVEPDAGEDIAAHTATGAISSEHPPAEALPADDLGFDLSPTPPEAEPLPDPKPVTDIGDEPPPAVVKTPEPAAAPPPVPAAPAFDAVEMLLSGAGIDPSALSAVDRAALRPRGGQILYEAVKGLITILNARTMVKSDLRMEQTMLQPLDNNPLKFSYDPLKTLISLLDDRRPGFMDPVTATKGAVQDILAHQVALVGAIQIALGNLFERFRPENLQQRLEAGSLIDNLLPAMRKARYWEIYEKDYRNIAEEMENNFHGVFGKALSDAYDAQMAPQPDGQDDSTFRKRR